jgi:hypothetical protein
MGLLDIWNDWKKDNQGTVQDDFSGMNSDAMSPSLNTAGGITNPSYNRNESPLVKNPIFTKENFKKAGNTIYDSLPGSDFDRKFAVKEAEKTQGTPLGKATDPITQGGTGVKFAEDQGFLSKLSNMAGVDMDKAAANWKDKGGFEGLMSNPAFSLGLALMQSSANGKTINQGILDNFVKSAKISAEFKDRIEARKQEPIQATQADIGEMKDMLGRFKIAEPNIWEKGFSFLKGEDATADYDRAVESIAIEYQKRIANAQLNNKSNKPLVIDSTFKEKILKDMLDSKEFKEKKGWFGPFTKGTLEKKSIFRAQGGPVDAGKPYVVGEKGPEIIIPTSDGNVLSNDDSQIFNMLLASNPQLQKVSKQRAERILKARFPEYFEG